MHQSDMRADSIMNPWISIESDLTSCLLVFISCSITILFFPRNASVKLVKKYLKMKYLHVYGKHLDRVS